MENLAERVKCARKTAGLTQAELAESISVSRNYIAQVEMGRKRPGIKTIDLIAKATNTTTIDILKGDEFLERISEIVSKDDVEALKKELNALLVDL